MQQRPVLEFLFPSIFLKSKWCW